MDLEEMQVAERCFYHLEKWYDPGSEVATQKLFYKFHDFTIPPNGNSIEALHALEDTNNQMTEKGMGILDTFLHVRFVRALAQQAMKNCDRAEIIRMNGTRYSTLPEKKGSQRSSRPPKQTFFRAKAATGEVRDGVVTAVAGAPRTVAAAGSAIRVEVAAAEDAAAAPVVPTVVATAAVADLMAAVGDATEGAKTRRSAPRRRVKSSPSVLGARSLATRRARSHRTRGCWRWSCRCQKRISPWKPRPSWRRKQASGE